MFFRHAFLPREPCQPALLTVFILACPQIYKIQNPPRVVAGESEGGQGSAKAGC